MLSPGVHLIVAELLGWVAAVPLLKGIPFWTWLPAAMGFKVGGLKSRTCHCWGAHSRTLVSVGLKWPQAFYKGLILYCCNFLRVTVLIWFITWGSNPLCHLRTFLGWWISRTRQIRTEAYELLHQSNSCSKNKTVPSLTGGPDINTVTLVLLGSFTQSAAKGDYSFTLQHNSPISMLDLPSLGTGFTFAQLSTRRSDPQEHIESNLKQQIPRCFQKVLNRVVLE